ncbi:MAG: M23 family metallopeptidase, partial [Chthoniobacterales bacterium]
MSIAYSLPFEGRWFVMQGGDTLNVNHHMKEPSQRYGLDFAKVGGESLRALSRIPRPEKAEDFFAWAEPVLSPAAGIVREVADGLPDNSLGTTDPQNAFGNYVVIEVEAGEFAFLAHFKNGSLAVKPGDRIAAGQRLGLCGNSGNSTAPHIHMHVQDTPRRYEGRGRNVVFERMDVELSGKSFTNVCWPLTRGLFVSS